MHTYCIRDMPQQSFRARRLPRSGYAVSAGRKADGCSLEVLHIHAVRMNQRPQELPQQVPHDGLIDLLPFVLMAPAKATSTASVVFFPPAKPHGWEKYTCIFPVGSSCIVCSVLALSPCCPETCKDQSECSHQSMLAQMKIQMLIHIQH